MNLFEKRIGKLEQRYRGTTAGINIVRQIIVDSEDNPNCPGCEQLIREAPKSKSVNRGVVITKSVIECPISCSRESRKISAR